MTREEAAKRLEEQLAKETMYWGNYFESEVDREVARLAIAALNEVGSPTTQLDENGLMPCGCGGPVQLLEDNYCSYWVECAGCGIKLGYWESMDDGEPNGSFGKKRDAVKVWNTAMGWRVEG